MFDNCKCSKVVEEDGQYLDNESEEDGELEESGLEKDTDASSSSGKEEEEGDFCDLSMYDKMIKSAEKRMGPLGHDYAILGWICFVHPDVRKDVKKVQE